jgi:hypothetical protein
VFPDGTIVNIHGIEARLPVLKMFPLPVDLLELAQWARDQAARPGADHRASVLCVLLAAAAAEGVVNSLLEPLVTAEEWQDPARRDKGLNWASVRMKWIKLSEKLKMRRNSTSRSLRSRVCSRSLRCGTGSFTTISGRTSRRSSFP